MERNGALCVSITRVFALVNRRTCVGAASLVFILFALSDATGAPNCGGLNERACCFDETGFTCDAGLTPVTGCSGDCGCTNLPGINAIQTCRLITECDEGEYCIPIHTCNWALSSRLQGYIEIRSGAR